MCSNVQWNLLTLSLLLHDVVGMVEKQGTDFLAATVLNVTKVHNSKYLLENKQLNCYQKERKNLCY